MPEQPLIIHLTDLFWADLDAKNFKATTKMAVQWTLIEKRLKSQIELLAAELASPPGGFKPNTLTGNLEKLQKAGFVPGEATGILAQQGLFNVPDVQPEAKQIKLWQLAQMERYIQLLSQVQAEIEKFTGQTATPIIEQLVNDSAYASIQHHLIEMDVNLSTVGADVISTTFNRLNIEATQNIVAMVGAGKPLGDLLSAAYPATANAITNNLIYGTAVGWNPRKTARTIIEQGLSQGLNHILLVARDQQNRAVREAGRQAYVKSGIIQRYIRRAAHQSRTCLACLALDGSIWEVAELMPLHPQDRCSQVPLIPGFDPIERESGEDWFKRQPEEIQRQMMGPGKFKAWQEGRFEFSQLATIKENKIWGPNAQVTTLKDLLRGRGGLNGRRPTTGPKLPSFPTDQPPPSPLPALDHEALLNLDLHQVGPNWGQQDDWQNQSYGGVIFDAESRVLLRKPKGEFDGYAWTFAKGRMDGPGEHPVHTALREVEQETGHDCSIIGLVPGQFKAGERGTTNNFFLMKSNKFDKSKMDLETEDLIWATPLEAIKLIKQGKNKAGVERDLAILDNAEFAYGQLLLGNTSNDYLFQTPKKKNALITHFDDSLLADLQKQADSVSSKKALASIDHNGKGIAILDPNGKLKAIASYDDGGDDFISVNALWGDAGTTLKTTLINAGKLAAQQGKGIVVQIPGLGPVGSKAKQMAKNLGFEIGGQDKAFMSIDQFYLLPEWMSDWKKAPTKFKTPDPVQQPPPPPPATKLKRDSLGAGADLPEAKEQLLKTISDPKAKKGVETAFEKIQGGEKGFVYYDQDGKATGVISYSDQGGTIKVGSAGFIDFETNLQALKDVIKVAKIGGKDFVTFAPAGPILDQYKTLGFQLNQEYGNGASLILKKQNFDDWLKDPAKYGKDNPFIESAPAATSSYQSNVGGEQPVGDFKAIPRERKAESIPAPIGLPEPKDFPADPNSLTVVRRLGGSTGAVLVQDADGNLYVRKKGASREHIIDEAYADAVYQAIGANVPEFKLYDTPEGPVKLARFVEGDSLGDVLRAGGPRADKAKKEIQKLFAADALFSNRDVIGEGFDNILVDKNGKIWRIDNGGSFRFRAQGARKDDWNEFITDLWTMRDSQINHQTATVFGDLDFYTIADQILDLQGRRKAILQALPEELQDIMARRLVNAVDMATTAKAMQPDNFLVNYADKFSQQRMELRKQGITDQMPLAMDIQGYDKATAKQLYAGSGVNTGAVFDEEGRLFDRLRGRNSLINQLETFVQAAGGDYQLIRQWASQQVSNSWKQAPQALKYHIVENVLQKDAGLFWWRDGKTMAKNNYQKYAINSEVYAKTFQALHAFTQELIFKMDFPNKNIDNGTILLFRTEDKHIIQGIHDLSPGVQQVTMPRGVLESTSIFDAVYIGTTELTRQAVPFHRIMATYFTSRSPGINDDMFLGDGENEFVVILGGDLPFDYVATNRGQTVVIEP